MKLNASHREAFDLVKADLISADFP